MSYSFEVVFCWRLLFVVSYVECVVVCCLFIGVCVLLIVVRVCLSLVVVCVCPLFVVCCVLCVVECF